jgi:glycosyltransferase involved in cell wall biosynthesis
MKTPGVIPVDLPAPPKGEVENTASRNINENGLAGRRIAIFIQSLTIGGAERTALNHIQGFVQCGIQVDLLLADCSGAFLSELPHQVNVIDLKGKRVLFSLFPLVDYLRKRSPVILYSIQTHTNLIAIWASLLARFRAPIVISEHNTRSISLAASPSFRERMITILARWFFRYADAAVCVSQGVADDFVEITGLPRQKIHVVYNPVVSPELEQKAHASISHPWFKPDTLPVILAVGRLVIQKDYPTLLHAFSIVCRERPAHLLILGEGSERLRLEGLARQLGLMEIIQMPGFVENPFPYMLHARMLVLSSRWEGFGNVLVESLACGTPVVSTDCKSGPREILENGHFGRLVPVGDPEALAAAILETMQSTPDRSRLRQRAQDFTLEESVRKLIRIFESCLLSNEQ